jgi:polyisoprenyl-phosphate glycosyltransferase
MTEAPALSIVVPCYNEAECLETLHARLGAAAKAVAGEDYEIVLINDGSRDASWSIMAQLASEDPRLTCLDLSRNHGHQLALTAGLDLCRGQRIFIVDADLQDPPELLGAMIETMEREGADVVYGVRTERAGESWFKKVTAAGFYRLLKSATDVDIPLDAGDFRLMTRRALDVFLSMPEQARFVRGMVAWGGFRQVPFAYSREARFAGETKYPLSKMIRFALDALTGFSTAPLRLASHAGLWLALGSVFLIIYIGASWITGQTIQGWTSLMLVVVVLGAIQMFVLGMIGEYIGRLYTQSKNRPLYIVQNVAGGAVARATLGVNASVSERPLAVHPEGGERG